MYDHFLITINILTGILDRPMPTHIIGAITQKLEMISSSVMYHVHWKIYDIMPLIYYKRTNVSQI